MHYRIKTGDRPVQTLMPRTELRDVVQESLDIPEQSGFQYLSDENGHSDEDKPRDDDESLAQYPSYWYSGAAMPRNSPLACEGNT